MPLTCDDEPTVDELPLTPDGLWSRLTSADEGTRARMLEALTVQARRATACIVEGHPRSGT